MYAPIEGREGGKGRVDVSPFCKLLRNLIKRDEGDCVSTRPFSIGGRCLRGIFRGFLELLCWG